MNICTVKLIQNTVFRSSARKFIFCQDFLCRNMAHSRFEYVKSFEIEERLEPNQWIVIQIKCCNERFTQLDDSTLFILPKIHETMIKASNHTLTSLRDIVLSYGYASVFNLILDKNCTLYKRRAFKILSNIVSLYSSAFGFEWKNTSCSENINCFFPPLLEGNIYLFPKDQQLRDFLTNEQSICHERNLTLTTLRNLVKVTNLSFSEAVEKVKNSTVSDKNEMLFSLCDINYNDEPLHFKKGTIQIRRKLTIVDFYQDFKKDAFWREQFPLEEITNCSTKIAYLKYFNRKSIILPHTWLVVRIDGKSFHKFSEMHSFVKPNDVRAIKLMSASAQHVMETFSFIILSYGQSDEYSFIIKRYGHKQKDAYLLTSKIVNSFTVSFVSQWSLFFEDEMKSYPSFDARLIHYPTNVSLRDYLSWRQADCHINNMYNTCFWKLVNVKGLSRNEAQLYLKGTFSKDKLAILKDEFGNPYSEEEDIFCKGTVITHKQDLNNRENKDLMAENIDIIKNEFWEKRPWILGHE